MHGAGLQVGPVHAITACAGRFHTLPSELDPHCPYNAPPVPAQDPPA